MSVRFSSFVAGAFTVAAAALAACGGSNNTPSSSGPCGAPSGQVVLAYPAPNSTGIPDNFTGIIFASTGGLTNSYQALIVPNGASVATSLLPVAAFTPPLPSPAAVPSFANPVYQSSASNGFILPAATQIFVYLNDLNSNCTASLQGSFTSR